MKSKVYLKEEYLKLAFSYFDKVTSINNLRFLQDGNGKISQSELKEVLSNEDVQIADDELLQIIREVDTNKDGYVDYNEFIAMMSKNLKI